MCEYCEQYGEGTYWYLNPRSYARQLYRRTPPGKKVVPKVVGEAQTMDELIQNLMDSRFAEDPSELEKADREINEFWQQRNAPCQVLPLEDCFEIIDNLGYPIAALSCVCRRQARAKEETNIHEYSCLGLGVGMLKWERWPERYKGGVEFLSQEEAKDLLVKWNRRGLMHMVMVYGHSEEGNLFVGGICNCDYPDCMMIRLRLDYNIKYALLKSHYVAVPNYALLDYEDNCTGCGVCVQRCHYGAIKMEVTLDKPNIDMTRCFGCGLCQTGCPAESIQLMDRDDFPALKGKY